MGMIEGKKQPASGPSDSGHGSMTHEHMKELVSGRGASKVAPDVRRGGHDHRQGPPASEGENAVRNLGRQVRK